MIWGALCYIDVGRYVGANLPALYCSFCVIYSYNLLLSVLATHERGLVVSDFPQEVPSERRPCGDKLFSVGISTSTVSELRLQPRRDHE